MNFIEDTIFPHGSDSLRKECNIALKTSPRGSKTTFLPIKLQQSIIQAAMYAASEDGAAPYAGDAEIALVAGKAGILHLFAGCTSDGCKPLVHLQTGKGGETPCFPAQRKDVADTESRHRTHAQKQTL